MRQKPIDNLCISCDIKCSVPLTANEKRLSTALADEENHPNYHASCRMALLTPNWRKIIHDGVNARTAREREFAVWCKHVRGEYCTWGSEWPK